MAFTASSATTSLVASVYVNTSTSATPNTNITGAAATCYGGECDNRMNPNNGVWLKLYDASSPTNSSDPLAVLYTGPSSVGRFVFPEGMTFATALSVLVTTSPRVGQGNSPTNKVAVRLLAV
jgi:hypothetical protein